MTSNLGPFSTQGTTPTSSQRRLRLGVRALAATATAGLLLGVAGVPAFADSGLTDTGTVVANVVVESAISLTVDTASFTLTGVPGSTEAEIGAVDMTVETNNLLGYAVTVLANTAVLSPAAVSTPANPDTIPIGLLSVRETGTPDYTPLSTTVPVTVGGSATRSAEVGDAISNDFSVDIPFVNEDTYTATLTYTATTL